MNLNPCEGLSIVILGFVAVILLMFAISSVKMVFWP